MSPDLVREARRQAERRARLEVLLRRAVRPVGSGGSPPAPAPAR